MPFHSSPGVRIALFVSASTLSVKCSRRSESNRPTSCVALFCRSGGLITVGLPFEPRSDVHPKRGHAVSTLHIERRGALCRHSDRRGRDDVWSAWTRGLQTPHGLAPVGTPRSVLRSARRESLPADDAHAGEALG
jgi:hypothetical protein